MDCNVEKECSALGGLFQNVVNSIKANSPLWEDFVVKASKLQSQLRLTVQASDAFLDALQRIADAGTGGKSGTRDIGTALIRICLRHRSIENRLKTLSSSLSDCLVGPLEEKIDEWRRAAIHLEKEHAKEYKRIRGEIKKRSVDTVRLQKKARKGSRVSSNSTQRMLDSATRDLNERYGVLLDVERRALRAALIEQRGQFCSFVNWIKPFLDAEMALLSEVVHLQEVVDCLNDSASDPYHLPADVEESILNVKTLDFSFQFQTPPSSPGGSTQNNSLNSRKSSYCSLNSLESLGSSLPASSVGHASTGGGNRFSRNVLPETEGFYSVSSQDSGFTSQDAGTFYREREHCTSSLPPIAPEHNNAKFSTVTALSMPPSPTSVGGYRDGTSSWAPSATTNAADNARSSAINLNYAQTQRHSSVPTDAIIFQQPLPNQRSVAQKCTGGNNYNNGANSRESQSVYNTPMYERPVSVVCRDKNEQHMLHPSEHSVVAAGGGTMNYSVPIVGAYKNAVDIPVYSRSASVASSPSQSYNRNDGCRDNRRPLSFVGNDDVAQWINSDLLCAHVKESFQTPQQQEFDAGDCGTLTRSSAVYRRPSNASKPPPPPPVRRTSTLSAATTPCSAVYPFDMFSRSSCTTPTTTDDFLRSSVYSSNYSPAPAAFRQQQEVINMQPQYQQVQNECYWQGNNNTGAYGRNGAVEEEFAMDSTPRGDTSGMEVHRGSLLLEIQAAKVKLRKTE